MGAVANTLEAWLGVRHAGAFYPREEEISRLEGFAEAYNTAPPAVARRRTVVGFVTVATGLAALLFFFGRAGWASGIIGLLVQAGFAYFVIDGVARKGLLFARVRGLVSG